MGKLTYPDKNWGCLVSRNNTLVGTLQCLNCNFRSVNLILSETNREEALSLFVVSVGQRRACSGFVWLGGSRLCSTFVGTSEAPWPTSPSESSLAVRLQQGLGAPGGDGTTQCCPSWAGRTGAALGGLYPSLRVSHRHSAAMKNELNRLSEWAVKVAFFFSPTF